LKTHDNRVAQITNGEIISIDCMIAQMTLPSAAQIRNLTTFKSTLE